MHGLPRLLNDADVDNDMPADCILEDINAEYVSYPLPGENTPLFLFNQYILLSKKLSTVLEQLYTTTQRRGGADKITRLDRDLRVWNHTFNGLVQTTSFEIGEYTYCLADETEHRENVLMMTWLQLLANIAMLLIHWPALTFSTETPEFVTSLGACVRSSTALIEILDDHRIGWWLRSLCPSAPRLVFQSALVHIYCHCNSVILTRASVVERLTSISIVTKAIGLLNSYMPSAMGTSNSYTPGDIRSQWISDAASTLHSLSIALSTVSPAHNANESPMALGEMSETLQVPQSMETQASITNIESWNTNTLESLNNLNNFDWIWSDDTSFTPMT